jgi:hypothetical protein
MGEKDKLGVDFKLTDRKLILNFNFRLLEDRYSVLKNEEFVKHVEKGLKEIYWVQTKNKFIEKINELSKMKKISVDDESNKRLNNFDGTSNIFIKLAKNWLMNLVVEPITKKNLLNVLIGLNNGMHRSQKIILSIILSISAEPPVGWIFLFAFSLTPILAI